MERVQVSFTTEAKTAIIQAGMLATAAGSSLIESSHLAKALLLIFPEQAASVLREMNISKTAFIEHVEEEISLVPKGGQTPSISSALNSLIRSSTQNGVITHLQLLRSIAEELRPAGERESGLPGRSSAGRSGSTAAGNQGLRTLSRYAKNLNKLAREGKLSPVIGRESEIREVETALLRKTKCNPVLTGDAGVGKSAIVEGLASQIVNGNVPEGLRDSVVYQLEVSNLLAGASSRGEFEERVQSLLGELEEHPEIVLFIDEFHTLVGAGGCGAHDAANMLKPAMARGAIRLIGATTNDEYARIIEDDKAFERRLQKVRVLELPPEETVEVLLGIKPSYEAFHGVSFDDDLVRLSVRLTEQYVPSRRQPDKSIDLMDESMARTRMEAKEAVDENTLRVVLEKWTGVPASRIGENEARNLIELEERLSRQVRGQDQAIAPVADAIRRNMLHLSDKTRPVGSFLFVGPTGVGKTELCKALAKEVTGNSKNLIRIDMSEYQASFTVSRLFGSPPGYVGYNEGGQLTEAVRRNPYSVVLLDEIEKAHPSIFEAFLQVLDAGRMTDGQGRVVDFRNTLIVMTSNLGSRMLSSRHAPIGFTAAQQQTQAASAAVVEAVKEYFTPEFLNRLDGIIQFRPLDRALLVEIAGKQLAELQERLSREGYNVTFGDNLPEWIADKDAQPEYGARPIHRTIERYIVGPLSQAFLGVERPQEQGWQVQLEEGRITVSPSITRTSNNEE